MRKVTFPFLCLSLATLLVGCATTIVTRMVDQQVPPANDKKTIIDAITYALTNNGFDIAFINESYGLISTAWRPIESGSDTAASAISIIASAISRRPTAFSTYSRQMVISIQVLQDRYRVIPKLRHITNTSSIYASSSRDSIEYPTQDSDEGKLVVKIISEINGLLNITDDFEWQEKEISIDNQPQ
jgi:hypothetical protein